MKNRDKEREPARRATPPDPEDVARRAYELYQARGREPGRELEDWLQAEREINRHGEVAHSG